MYFIRYLTAVARKHFLCKIESLSQRLLRTIAIDKLSDAVSRGWGKHHQAQSCSNRSRHAHFGHLIATSRIMGAPVI